MTERALKALASAIFLARRQVNTADLTDDDQKIRVSGLYDDWTLGKYAVGDIRNTGGQAWECFQAHDNATYPDITPDSAAWFTFWRPLHGKTPETARPFVPVQGSHDMYRAGEYMIWTDGAAPSAESGAPQSTVYRCIAPDGTNFSPADYPQAWEEVTA